MTNTSTRLDRARASLAETTARIGDVQVRRNAALLADAKAFEIGKIDAELKGLQHAAVVESDRIKLLQSELARERAEAAAQRHETHLREFEKTLAQADTAGDELQNAAAQLERSFRETIRLRELALSMWPHGKSSHGDAVAGTPEGCAMSAGAVVTLLQHELHRVGTEARLGGSPSERVKVPLPGGAPARLTPLVDQKTKQPVPLLPLGEVLRNASRFAISTLRGNKFVPPTVAQPEPDGPRLVFGEDTAAAPAAPPKVGAPTPTQSPATVSDIDPLAEYVPPALRSRLADLLARQLRLGQSAAPEDERAYEQCLAELVALRAEIERAKQGEAA